MAGHPYLQSNGVLSELVARRRRDARESKGTIQPEKIALH